MRTAPLLLAWTMTAATVSAQATTTNVFGIWPDSADALSRSGVPGSSQGDVLIEVRGRSYGIPANRNGATGADFVSIGDRGSRRGDRTPGDGRLNGFQVMLQDQDASTPELFSFCIVAEDPTALGNPVPPPADLFRTANLATPPGTGIMAWTITMVLATPADVIPNGFDGTRPDGGNSSWYLGVGLHPSPTWTADGLAIHMASFAGLGPPFPNAGDNPRDGVVSIQQSRDLTNGVVVPRSSTARTHAIFLLTEAPVFQHGAVISATARVGADPCFGVAGSYPDACGVGNLGRMSAFPGYPGRAGVGDGYAFRLRAAGAAGVPAVLLLSAGTADGFAGSPIYLPFFEGALVVDPGALVALPLGSVPASEELVRTLQAASAAKPLCLPAPARMGGQVVLLRSPLDFSNGASISF